MKFVKNFFQNAIIVLLILANVSVFAQNTDAQNKARRGGHEMHSNGDMAARMQKNLGLTDDQTSLIKSINEKYAQKMQDLRKTNADKSQVKALMEAQDAEIKGVLTADQYAKFSTNRAKRMDKMEDRMEKKADRKADNMDRPMHNDKENAGRPNMRGGNMAERMKTELGLNDDQTAQIKAINENYAKKMQDLRGSGDKTAAKALMEAQDAEIKGVLTADQYAKFSAKRQENMGKMKGRRGGTN